MKSVISEKEMKLFTGIMLRGFVRLRKAHDMYSDSDVELMLDDRNLMSFICDVMDECATVNYFDDAETERLKLCELGSKVILEGVFDNE